VRVVAERVEIMNAGIPDILALSPQDSAGDPLASNPG
jgi:hypothetical protein